MTTKNGIASLNDKLINVHMNREDSCVLCCDARKASRNISTFQKIFPSPSLHEVNHKPKDWDLHSHCSGKPKYCPYETFITTTIV